MPSPACGTSARGRELKDLRAVQELRQLKDQQLLENLFDKNQRLFTKIHQSVALLQGADRASGHSEKAKPRTNRRLNVVNIGEDTTASFRHDRLFALDTSIKDLDTTTFSKRSLCQFSHIRPHTAAAGSKSVQSVRKPGCSQLGLSRNVGPH